VNSERWWRDGEQLDRKMIDKPERVVALSYSSYSIEYPDELAPHFGFAQLWAAFPQARGGELPRQLTQPHGKLETSFGSEHLVKLVLDSGRFLGGVPRAHPGNGITGRKSGRRTHLER
jgi:hypothetical protein